MKKEFEQYSIKLLGSENAYFDDIHKRVYSYDATKKHYLPDGVLFPRNEEDISKILRFCNENNIIIIPRGADSGFTGGALAVNGGLILSFEEHMNKILEIDLENLVAAVQPGVINIHLQREVAKHRFFYPPDPASMEYSGLGGNVGENAGGMRTAKYGITEGYAMALGAMLPSGEIIRADKRTTKDVAGYNLAGILIASEGPLAVLSEPTLKLTVLPKFKKTAFGIFPSVKSAMDVVYKSLTSGANPVSMEFSDNLSIRAVESKFSKGLPVNTGAILTADVGGNVKEAVNEDLKILGEHLLDAGASQSKVVKDEQGAADIWFARRNYSQSIAMYGILRLNEDITIPRSKPPALLEGIDEISKKYGFKIPCFGHTGDGDVHTSIMVPDKDDEEQVKKGYEVVEEVFKLTVELGGTLSREHGVGFSKAPFMKLALSDAEVNLVRNVKEAFDPNNILSPFKMGL